MVKYHEAASAVFFSGLAGAEVSCVNPDGEITFTLGLPAGQHKAANLLEYMAPGDELTFSGDITVLIDGGVRVRRHAYGEGATDTGANPQFRPTLATEHEVRLRKLLQQVNEKSDSLDKRLKSLAAIPQVSKKQQTPEPAPEPAPDPAPEPEAATEKTVDANL